jgi:ElaB/YqjD/DUF883 family membrane-anchored ribosome-binding protein
MLERTAAEGAALAKELRNVLSQVEELVHALGEDRDAAVVAARDRMNSVMSAAKGRLADIERTTHRSVKQVRRAARGAVTSARDYASENPWTVASIGAAVGILLAIVLRPGRRNRPKSEDEDD